MVFASDKRSMEEVCEQSHRRLIKKGRIRKRRQSCLGRENLSSDDPDVGGEAEVEEDEVEDEDEQGKPADHLGIARTKL